MKTIFKYLIFSVLILIFTSCRTKSVLKSEKESEVKELIKKDSLVKIQLTEEIKSVIENSKKEIESTDRSNLEISGTTDSENDFFYHNIVGKDTLQTIKISGNSTFSIKNNSVQSEKSTTEKKEITNENKAESITQSATLYGSIKTEKQSEITKEKEVKNILNIWWILLLILLLIFGYVFWEMYRDYKKFKI
jgi:hypothetical protein